MPLLLGGNDVQKQGADTLTTYVSNYFLDGASGYALGAVTSSTAAQYKNGGYLRRITLIV